MEIDHKNFITLKKNTSTATFPNPQQTQDSPEVPVDSTSVQENSSVSTDQSSTHKIEKNKKSVIMLASVKGGSSKTYDSLLLAFTLTNMLNDQAEEVPQSEQDQQRTIGHQLIPGHKPKVCVIDLDLSATNMNHLLSLAESLLGENLVHLQPINGYQHSIHEYLVSSAGSQMKLEDCITRLTYQETDKYQKARNAQIDFILGSGDAQWWRIFSQSRISNYENAVSEVEARRLLHRLLDGVIRRDYDAIIIDLQPGMEGLCHAAMEYFASISGNEYHSKGFNESSIRELFLQYTTHLCMASTTDWTQFYSNLKWLRSQRVLCKRITKKHIIIKDNRSDVTHYFETVPGAWQQFRDRVEHRIDGENLEDYVNSMVLIRNNQCYVDFYCTKEFLQSHVELEDLTPRPSSIQHLFGSQDTPGGYELVEWAQENIFS